METLSTTSALASALRTHGFVGRVVEPEHPDYDDCRFGWNGAIDRRPAAVAYATDADDVAAAVRAATENGFPFTVRSGVPLGLGALGAGRRAVPRPPRSQRGGRGPGDGQGPRGRRRAPLRARHRHPGSRARRARGADLAHGRGRADPRRRRRLADAGPRPDDRLAGAPPRWCSPTAARCGPARTSTPTCSGRCAAAAATSAIVTEFEFQARPVGPMVLGGMLAYPWDQAREAFRASRELIESAPDELMIFDVLITAPPGAAVPAGAAGTAGGGGGHRVVRRPRRGRAGARAAARGAPAGARPRPADALRRAPDDARRDRSPRAALLRQAPLPRRGERRLHRRAGRRVRERSDAAVARGDRLDGRRGGPRAARRHGVRPSRRARARMGDRVLGRRADRADHRLGEAHLGRHPRPSPPTAST